jgi:hypothetical protein
VSNLVLSHMIKWFAVNNLALNLDMNIMKFITKHSSHSLLHIGCKKKVCRKYSEHKISWFTN